MVDIGESWAVTTLAERPELLDAAIGLGMLDETAAFMSSNLVGLITSPSRFRDLWPELAVIVLDSSGAVIARAFAVSYATSGGHARAELPDHGWEAVLIWAAEDKLDHCRPDTAAAVTVTVAPDRRGQGVSTVALRALAQAASDAGLRRLICPVRPAGKALEPAVPMNEYVARKREDGLPADPWLRAHVRAGGVISRIAPFAMTIQGTLQQWRKWTGKAFDHDGLVPVEGALVPVIASIELDSAVYIEPNVWVEYHLDEPLADVPLNRAQG